MLSLAPIRRNPPPKNTATGHGDDNRRELALILAALMAQTYHLPF